MAADGGRRARQERKSARTSAQRSALDARRGVDVEPVDESPEPGRHPGPDGVELADHGEGPEHLVVDERRHVVPGTPLRERVELPLQVPPPVELQDRLVGGGGSIEGELFAGGGGRRLHRLLVHPGDHHARKGELEGRPVPTTRGEAPLHGRQRHLAQVALGGEGVDQQAIRHLAGHLGHETAHPGQEDRRAAPGVGAGIEHGGHEDVAVELAPEGEPAAVGPRGPDGPDGQDELPHPGCGVGPRHREALLDVGLDLGAQTEQEAALGQRLEVVGGGRHGHRIAGEGHGDPRAHLDPCGVLGRQDQGQERVVVDLGRPDPVVPGRLGRLGLGDDPRRVEADGPVDEHGPR